MARYHGKVTTFKITDAADTERDLSAFVTDASDDIGHDVAEATAKGDAAKVYVAGHYGATISISGRFDDTATTGPDVVLAGLIVQDEAKAFEIGYGGDDTGQRIVTGSAFITQYSRSSPLAGAVDFTAAFTVTGEVTHGTVGS